MIRQVAQIAPVAALLAIGMPAPSATAAGAVPALQSDEALTLVGEDRRRGGERGDRSERRGDRGDRGDRERGARTFHRDDDRDRRFRRNRDGRDIWYGFGPTYDDCDWLRRRARATGSDYWWRRYRQCVQHW